MASERCGEHKAANECEALVVSRNGSALYSGEMSGMAGGRCPCIFVWHLTRSVLRGADEWKW